MAPRSKTLYCIGMSAALDVGIGVIFVYLFLSLIVTTVQELVSTVFSLRAKQLYAALQGVLKDEHVDLSANFFRHELIANLVKTRRPAQPNFLERLDAKGLPSYIPSKTFALVLLDILQRPEESSARLATGADTVFVNAKQIVSQATLPTNLKSALLLLLDDTRQDTALAAADFKAAAQSASAQLEAFFNDRMARASGWYKRRMQLVSLLLAAGVTLLFNADSLAIAKALWVDPELRQHVAELAEAYVQTQPAATVAGSTSEDTSTEQASPELVALRTKAEELTKQVTQLNSLGLPLGWTEANTVPDNSHWYESLLGWLITALAVSLGAGFWFDLLSKALQLRGSGNKISAATGATEEK